VQLKDLSIEEFTLQKETKLVRNFIKNKFVVFEFENEKGNIDLYVLDL